MEKQQLRQIIEGALLAYGQPLPLNTLHALFVTETIDTDEGDQQVTQADVSKEEVEATLQDIQQDCDDQGLGYELKEVGSGWRFQVRAETAPWVNKLWDEKPQRYSRALMETLAIIAYRQPITRGDIEEIRGVAVSSNIIKTLSEREWIKVVGQRDVPGRPSLYATTKQFLDYFNLQSLEELPSLRELTDIEALMPELNLVEGSGGDGAVLENETSSDSDITLEADVTDDSNITNTPVASVVDIGTELNPVEELPGDTIDDSTADDSSLSSTEQDTLEESQNNDTVVTLIGDHSESSKH